MIEIVKVMLAEGIDEETIHRALNVIEEKYEVVDEGKDLAGVVQRAEEEGKISGDKAEELTQKALRIPGSNDIFINKNGKKDYSNYTPKKRGSKHDRGNLDQEVDAMMDPKRKKRHEELGRILVPGDDYPETFGKIGFRQMRINRKKDEVANKK